MPTIDDLNRQFSIPDVARFEAGRGGLTRLAMTGPAADAHLYLHGAHIAHYQPRGRGGVLFVSSRSFFEPGKAIRGGIPVIFPWFGQRSDTGAAAGAGAAAPMHGLVRTMEWTVADVSITGDAVNVALTFDSSDDTRADWPHDFKLRLLASFGSALHVELQVNNTGSTAFSFEEALHTYFAIGDVRSSPITGLCGRPYLDKNRNHERFTDDAGVLQLNGPTDRVYQSAPGDCLIDDKINTRHINLRKTNSQSTVVWNPWSDRITSFADLDAQEWPGFVCVETGNVKEHAVTLAAGAMHAMGMSITVR